MLNDLMKILPSESTEFTQATEPLERWCDVPYLNRIGMMALSALPPLSLYIHWPWCVRKCHYCDFNSHTLPHPLQEAQGQALQQRYLKAVLADLTASLPLIWGRRIGSIFIGGGTPSLMDVSLLADLIGQIRALLPLLPDAEITLEANPGTYERGLFRDMAQAGINRLSLGVQSFNDDLLQRIGRIHHGHEAQQAAEEALMYIKRVNLDVMYALPTQTLTQWQHDLDRALSLAPQHLSIYHLTVEPNTRFATHPPPLPDEDLAWDMLDHALIRTEATGWQRYEVSAYALSGYRCHHNLNYWEFGDYLGIGAGAHSKISMAHRILRQIRYRDPARYMMQSLEGQPVSQWHTIKRQDLVFEFMLGALRLRSGFHESLFTQRTGCPFHTLLPQLEQAQAKGWIEYTQDGMIRPTTLGFDFLSDLQSLFL